MYFKILSVIAIIEIAWGTIFSVLSIIKMSFKDVIASQSCNAFNSVHKSNLLQRYYVRCGMVYILAGSILQIYLVCYIPSKLAEFLLVMLLGVTIPIVLSVKEKRRYDNELIELQKSK